MTIIFTEPNCCIKCNRELPYYTLAPTKCEDCWSDEISERLIAIIKDKIHDHNHINRRR